MEIKKHYKMFKSGKKWAFASIATASLGLVALNTNAEKAHADSDAQANTNSASQLDQQTKTAPVNEKQVTLAKPATVKTSSAAVQSAAPAKSNVDSAVAKPAPHSDAVKVETKATTSSAAQPAKAAKKAVSSAAKEVPASSAAKKKVATSANVASSAAPSSAASKKAVSTTVQSSAAKQTTSSAAQVNASSAAAKSAVDSSAVSQAAQKDAKTTKTAEKKNDNSSKNYTIDNTYRLAENEGSDQKTNNKIIVAHAVGQYSSARDVAIYEKREWDSSGTYVQYIVGDGGRVYAVGDEGYVAWGAGKWANENAPVQVELAQTYSDSQFKKDYETYVNLLRDSAKKWNIPTTLDSDEYTGIKSHVWVTEHIWGNHVDPYGYLGTHGITKEQFAHDLAYGFGDDNAANDNNGQNNHQNDNQNNNNQNNNHQNDSNNNNHGDQNKQTYHVGDKVTIKNGASHWATGQSIYDGVKGKSYKVIQTNGNRLLLDKVISWINKSDVHVPGSNSNNSGNQNHNNNNNNNHSNTESIHVGSKVTINNNAKRWATGQNIYSGVKGKTYTVIQMNGSRLLLDKVISWINKGDVHLPGSSNGSQNNNHNNNNNANNNDGTIRVGTNVTIKQTAKRWATGQNIYNGVKGKTYKVIQINGNRLLLDRVISWINKGDVYVPGASNNNGNNNNNNNQNNNAGNYHFTNQHWTAAQTNFVNGIVADVMSVCQSNNLYASVAMAQAVVESAYGSSTLAQEAHNLFGIKADSTWHGATYTKNTQEVINGRTVTISAAFRKYDSFKDSIADYAKKLESRPQYVNAFSNHAHNYVESVKAIKAGGYATAPTYVSSIVNCINNYGFYKLNGLNSAISL
ncbi:glucosaminidase domain-containing protein [Pediococcus acidilactici]